MSRKPGAVHRIQLLPIDGATFTADRFTAGPDPVAPITGGTYILYETDTGRLRVDWNGPNVGASELVALLVGAPTLLFTDLLF